jgi:hypothetical protein
MDPDAFASAGASPKSAMDGLDAKLMSIPGFGEPEGVLREGREGDCYDPTIPW